MSGGSQQSSSQTSVPAWLQPYIQNTIGQAQTLQQGGGPQYYPGQQVASLNPMQQAGIQGVANTAAGPNASTVAQNQNMKIESGAYLNPSTNPYLAGTLTTAEQGVQNPITSEFGAAGRNVLASAPVQSSAMNQLANQIYGGAYNQGMTNMVQSQYAAPALDAATYGPSQELLQTGAGVQGQTQNEINAAMQKYNYTQQLPENMLSWLSGITSQSGAPFGTSNTTASGTNNPWTSGLGGAASGAALGSSFGPYGTAAGGLLGGLAGGLSSDRRLKRDIKALGKDSNGLERYRFRYLNSDRWYRGYMADEVEQVYPDAVITFNGFKRVRYEMIPNGEFTVEN